MAKLRRKIHLDKPNTTKQPTEKPKKKALLKVKPPPLPDQKLAILESDILQRLAAANANEVEGRAEVGGWLIEVKVNLKHGEWLPWLSTKMPLKPPTAKRAIQLHHFRNKFPGVFGQLATLGLTKAYHLMTLSSAARDAFLAKAHWVPSVGAKKTPLRMTFAEMMEVLHPPEPETPQETTTKAYRALRRSVSLLERALKHLSDVVPSWRRSPALKTALSTLDQEVERIGSRFASKSLIVASGVSFP